MRKTWIAVDRVVKKTGQRGFWRRLQDLKPKAPSKKALGIDNRIVPLSKEDKAVVNSLLREKGIPYNRKKYVYTDLREMNPFDTNNDASIVFPITRTKEAAILSKAKNLQEAGLQGYDTLMMKDGKPTRVPFTLDDLQPGVRGKQVKTSSISMKGRSSIKILPDKFGNLQESKYGIKTAVNAIDNSKWDWTRGNKPQIGTVKRGGKYSTDRLSKTNLEDKEALLAINTGKHHFYALEYDSGDVPSQIKDYLNKAVQGNEPSRLIEAKGQVLLGKPVGTITMKSSKKEHPVFDRIQVIRQDNKNEPSIMRNFSSYYYF